MHAFMYLITFLLATYDTSFFPQFMTIFSSYRSLHTKPECCAYEFKYQCHWLAIAIASKQPNCKELYIKTMHFIGSQMYLEHCHPILNH